MTEFLWYSMQGDDNPKSKSFKSSVTAPTGQFEETVVVVTPAEPASTSTAAPPGPFTSADPEIPSSRAQPITAYRLSQALLSINNWMQTASSKLSILTTTVEAQSPPPQDPTPAIHPQPEQSQRTPKRKTMIPRADDAVIQLVDPQETSSSQPQDAPPSEPVQVQAQVPVAEQQATGNQTKVPEHREDPGTTHEPM
ncbi:PREDICTED: predicted GPI-anchored protein 58 [Nicotiana attenuata]|uniref:predicted GPI-anchored protein 58 n=1 Tax=Nicotiana attenuata TaxID=49451 RepID=UPI000905666E|nr:PREDICTED: predicted GPI-anchored protein 58 [Nicotiana attenuata]